MLLFVDNIFRFTQAGSEVSALLGRIPSAVGYQPTLSTEMGELQERITSTHEGLDHLGAGHLRARRRPDRPGAGDRLRPPRRDDGAQPRKLTEIGIYPAVDPLDSTSRILDPLVVGEEHYKTARERPGDAAAYKELQDIIAILGMDELSERGQARRGARPQDPALPLAAVLRRRAVHRHAGQVREARRTPSAASRRSSRASTTTSPSRPSTWSGTIEEAVEKAKKLAAG